VISPALADVRYDLAGEDVYRIVSASTTSRISYAGTEHLSVQRDGKALRFEARASYVSDQTDGKRSGDARFVAELLPNGFFDDRVDDDPNFLTILNQPFAVQLDAATLRDLRELRRPVPFSASSPLGGSTVLRGYLRPGIDGPIAGRPSVAVRFEAAGPMTGSLPGYAGATLTGSMRMDATAYYALDDAMLLALHATLTIDASLSRGRSAAVPVRITYLRSIRLQGEERAIGIKTPR
jgi:hypothetical protein